MKPPPPQTSSPRQFPKTAAAKSFETSAPIRSATRELKDEMDEELRVTTREKKVAGLKEVHKASLRDLGVENATKLKEELRKQQEQMEASLGVDSDAMKSSEDSQTFQKMANFTFLMVVLGCELDVYGFLLVVGEIWAQNEILTRTLVVLCPLGYVVATIMYLHYMASSKKTPPARPQSLPLTNASRSELPDTGPNLRELQREAVELQFYHFLPIIRYYVIVKERMPDDVEAIFRINSLSSFSLGIAQIIGILFHAFVVDGGKPLNVFHRISIMSQMINWGITILYFTTSVSGAMKSAVGIDAMNFNYNQTLKRKVQLVLQLKTDAGDPLNEKAAEDLKKEKQTLNNWILGLSEVTIDPEELDAFETGWKFEVIQKLMQKQIALYAMVDM